MSIPIQSKLIELRHVLVRVIELFEASDQCTIDMREIRTQDDINTVFNNLQHVSETLKNRVIEMSISGI